MLGAGSLSPRAAFSRWLQSRLPLTDTYELGQRNVYILPTPAGLTFAMTLVVMLLASINYQLNLGYALTFLLAGAGLVSMHLTHNNLRGLSLHLRPPTAVFAGSPAMLEVVVTNPGRLRHGLALRFDANSGASPSQQPASAADKTHKALVWCDAPSKGQTSLHISLVPSHRGWHAVPALVMETVFPFGLFRAWTVWRPAARVLAWPTPEPAPPPLPVSANTSTDERSTQRSNGGEWDGVRPWRRGDTMRQVVWKKVARSGELVSRETAGSAVREQWLDWADTATSDVEARLSRLTAWLLLAEHEGLACGLRLPGRVLPPDLGDAHRIAALNLLGQW